MTKKQSYLRCITRKHNKRGSGRDIVLMAVLLFVFAISALIMRYTTSHVVEIFYNSSDFNSSYNQSNYDITQMMKDSTDQTGGQLDYVILAIFIGLILGIVVTSWYIGGHPIFLFFYFIFIVIGVLLSVVFADVWDDVTSMSMFGGVIGDFPITTHLITYMPIYLAVVGMIGLVVMFGKPQGR